MPTEKKRPRRRARDWEGLTCEQVVADIASGLLARDTQPWGRAVRHLVLEAIALARPRVFASRPPAQQEAMLGQLADSVIEALNHPGCCDADGMAQDYCGRVHNLTNRVFRDWKGVRDVPLVRDLDIEHLPGAVLDAPDDEVDDEEVPELHQRLAMRLRPVLGGEHLDPRSRLILHLDAMGYKPTKIGVMLRMPASTVRSRLETLSHLRQQGGDE